MRPRSDVEVRIRFLVAIERYYGDTTFVAKKSLCLVSAFQRQNVVGLNPATLGYV